jgi:hypothetical protein
MRGGVGIESGIVGGVRKGPSTCPDLQQCHSTPPLERYHMWCSSDQSPLPPQGFRRAGARCWCTPMCCHPAPLVAIPIVQLDFAEEPKENVNRGARKGALRSRAPCIKTTGVNQRSLTGDAVQRLAQPRRPDVAGVPDGRASPTSARTVVYELHEGRCSAGAGFSHAESGFPDRRGLPR